jgi:hypothetical protein
MTTLISLLLSLPVVLAEEPEEASTEEGVTEDAAESGDENGDTVEEEVPVEEPEPEPESWDLTDAPGQVRPGGHLWELELLYHDHTYTEGLERTRALLIENPEDAALYWHAARFMFEIGERFDRTDESIDKEAWYQEMLAMSEKGLALDPTDAHLLFGKGIALGRYGTTRGVLATLFVAEDVESSWLTCANSDHTYRSIAGEEVLPCDCYLTLGIFYRLVPDSWLVKLIAGTKGDLDVSLEWLERATVCDPGDIGIDKELGVTQMCLAETNHDDEMMARARATLLKTRAIPPKTPSDYTDIGHMTMLLENPKLACEYSRDGQQDLDEDQLDAP